MCGICGILGQPYKETTIKMTRSMEHRGPDGEGFYFDDKVSLGVRRLQITGPRDNDQPIWNEDHTACVIFNGEIYNFKELRSQLEANGHIFRSSSDTEVILHLYEDVKEDCVNHFNGMFAFAIWDGKQLFLARDRIGIKPLFYSFIPRTQDFVFSSEMRAIKKHPHFIHTINEKAQQELSVMGYIMTSDITLETQIKQVEPGTTMTISYSDGAIRQSQNRYFTMPKTLQESRLVARSDPQQSIRRLEGAIRASCRAIMNQDTRLKGLYLSGGLDSTLLAVLCSQESSIPLHTFTLGDSPDKEDIKYARVVAEAIGSIHNEIIVGVEECLQEYPSFLESSETIPLKGTFDLYGDFAFFLLSKYIAKEVNVAICGEGADELFGGYWMHRWPLGYVDQVRERIAEQSTSTSRLSARINELFPEPEDRELYRSRVFEILLKGGLSNYHLWAVDRASMRYGLEVRVPYLFEDVVETAKNIPMSLKANSNSTKIIIRKMARDLFREYGLSDIVDRDKCAMPDSIKNIMEDFELPQSTHKAIA